MTSYTTGSSSLIQQRKKKKTQVFKYTYYQNQFELNEQKVINEALNIVSKEYTEQKISINYEEAKFVCYYFFSIFELCRKDFSILDKQLIQLYHDQTNLKEVRNTIDIILTVKKHQGVLQLRSLGVYKDNEIADNLSHKQIIQIEKSWSQFDLNDDGFINSQDIDQPLLHLLASYGIDQAHPKMAEIQELIDEWKLTSSFYLFFNEFASLICQINRKFPLRKNGSQKDSCSCNIF